MSSQEQVNIQSILNEIRSEGQIQHIKQETQLQYPLWLQLGNTVIEAVDIEDVYPTPKEVGALYDKDRLDSVLQAFCGYGQLTPIRVSVESYNERMIFKVLDGHHRWIAAHLYSFKKIPVMYEQEEYNGAQQPTRTASDQVYKPPQMRNLKN